MSTLHTADSIDGSANPDVTTDMPSNVTYKAEADPGVDATIETATSTTHEADDVPARVKTTRVGAPDKDKPAPKTTARTKKTAKRAD